MLRKRYEIIAIDKDDAFFYDKQEVVGLTGFCKFYKMYHNDGSVACKLTLDKAGRRLWKERTGTVAKELMFHHVWVKKLGI